MKSETSEFPITLEDVGAGSHPLRISAWLTEPLRSVLVGDRVVEIVMSGVTFDVSSPIDGVFMRTDKPVGTVVRPGDTLGWIRPSESEQR